MKAWVDNLKVRPWTVLTFTEKTLKYLDVDGKRVTEPFKFLIGISWIGEIQVELIEPVYGPMIYEAFIQKYPQSRYNAAVYSNLVKLYVAGNDIQKMQDAGEKAIALAPTDVQTLAILGQTLPRAWNANMPNAAVQLDKAEKYSKSAIELTPTIPKPDGMTDEQFTFAKNQTLAMAHSGLGLVYFRRGKYDEAIPEFEASTKVDPNPEADPVTFYVLAISDEKTSHFDAAVAAFVKCSTIPGSLQPTCKSGAEEAKKLGSTQLSAPK